MDYRDTIKTGDAVLFSGNTPTGFFLRTFVSSEWNHSGIAVRFVNEGSRKKISLTTEGELYILETNTGIRHDDIYDDEILGAGFSRADFAFKRYNKIAVRRLHDVFRTEQLARLTLEFMDKFRGNKFPSTSLPFLSVWLGIQLSEPSDEMFCSELMAHYYSYCIGPQYAKITGVPYNNDLPILFGTGAPTTQDMFTPGHYTFSRTPNASIFSGSEQLVYIEHGDMFYIILQPLLVILIFMFFIWWSLP